MSISTKKGDSGSTTLGKKRRVSKSHQIIAVLGDLDELNTYLGWACLMVTRIHAKQLAKIQTDLFWLGAILAGTAKKPGRRDDLTKRVAQLETELTTLEPQLPPLAQFILPGGCESACRLHLARAVCRRCERSLVALGKHAQLIPYLNRLSDFLFVLARFENYRHKVEADFVNWPPR